MFVTVFYLHGDRSGMTGDRRRSEVVAKLKTALDTEDSAEKNYHVRQALQLMELDGESELDGEPSGDEIGQDGGSEEDPAEGLS